MDCIPTFLIFATVVVVWVVIVYFVSKRPGKKEIPMSKPSQSDGPRVVDDRVFLLGLDEMYRNVIKVHERGELLECASRVAQMLQVEPETGNHRSLLNLEEGKLLSRVKKLHKASNDFAIRTLTALASVRGTDFAVALHMKATLVQVLTGKISVRAEGVEILVSDAFQTLIPPGEPPGKPEEIPADLMKELKTELKELDKLEAASADSGQVGETSQKETDKGTGDAGDGTQQDQTGMDGAQDIIEDSLTDSVGEQINNDISGQDEIFEGCCEPR